MRQAQGRWVWAKWLGEKALDLLVRYREAVKGKKMRITCFLLLTCTDYFFFSFSVFLWDLGKKKKQNLVF